MKFKKGDRVEYIGSNDSGFTRGAIYTVREDELNKYGHLTIELDDNGSNTNGHCPEYFKLIEENKMKTDAKTMAEVLRKVADNIESGLDKNNGIQAMYGNNEWEDRTTNDLCFVENVKYRIKPETIIVNGVEIPKPLDIKDLDSKIDYYTPFLCSDLYYVFLGFFFRSKGIKIAYATKEEAIEASKALFGIE